MTTNRNLPEVTEDTATVPMICTQTGIAACAGLALDAVLLNAALSDGRARAAIWASTPAVVVSRRDTQLPGFADSSSRLSDEGLPVLVRDSGGTAVLQGPGIVTLSLVHASPPSLEESYEQLRSVVAAAFAGWGIKFGLGAVDGAFCDGRHNLVTHMRKLAGTAQRRRRGRGRFAMTLAHAVILIDVDLSAMTRGINHFYSLAGVPRDFSFDICASLRDLAPGMGQELERQSMELLSLAARRGCIGNINAREVDRHGRAA